MSRLVASQRAWLAPAWVREDLSRKAQALPSLDLRFAESKSLTDAASGQSLVTFTRASSGTYVGSDGVLKTATTNEPRFDHNPTTGESLGLLVEEQRTNLIAYSQAVDDASWTKGDSTVTANATTAPDSTVTADKLIPNNGTTIGRLRYNPTLADNTAYTISVFVKAAEFSSVFIQLFDKSGTVTASRTLNASTGILSGSETGASVTSAQAFSNGWYRLILSNINSLAGATTPNIRLQIVETGNGTSGLFVWGFQIEAGAFPTSYIPTTTATATRSADVASITGTNFSSWYRQDEGTVFWEAALAPGNSASAFSGFWALNNGTGTNQIMAYAGNSTSHRMYVRESGTVYADVILPTFTVASMPKSVGVYKTNDVAGTTNGGAIGADATVVLPVADRLTIGAQATAAPTNGTIRRLTYWPARLANSTLQKITQ